MFMIWKSFAAAASRVMFEVWDGGDPVRYPRYAELLARNPLHRGWIDTATGRDSVSEAAHRAWLRTRPRP